MTFGVAWPMTDANRPGLRQGAGPWYFLVLAAGTAAATLPLGLLDFGARGSAWLLLTSLATAAVTASAYFASRPARVRLLKLILGLAALDLVALVLQQTR